MTAMATPGHPRDAGPIAPALVAAAAVLGWFALTLQLLLTAQLTVAQGGSVLAGVWIYLDYFTILTNLLAAAALTAAAGRARGAAALFLRLPESTTAITASILIVGITYNLLLRQLWHPVGWQRVADEALHVVMPALFALYWWLTVPEQALRVLRLAWWLLYPLGYLLYALGRGALDTRYPYPFLDVTALGYPRVLLNGGAVGLAFVIVLLLLLALARWQSRRVPPPQRD
jgi:hypothetical protein